MRNWPRAMQSRISLRSDFHGGRSEAWRTQRNIHRLHSRRMRSPGSWLSSRGPIRRMAPLSRSVPHLYLLRIFQLSAMGICWARGEIYMFTTPTLEAVGRRDVWGPGWWWWWWWGGGGGTDVDQRILVKNDISGSYTRNLIDEFTGWGTELNHRAIIASIAPLQLAVSVADVCLSPPHLILRNRPVRVVELDYMRRVV